MAFEKGAIKSFARHSRLGGTNLDSVELVREDFMKSVDYLRKIGFKRISLKTGSYGMEELAMAIKFASEAGLDLLTIDGSGGGTGMSPWNMMQSWGVPSINLHSKAYEYASILAAQGKRVVDLSFAGGFALEDSIFKGLALGAPYTKLICMGRAIMIPGFPGRQHRGSLHPDRKEKVNGNWDKLPASISAMGSTPEEIFASYYDVQKKVGKDEMKNIPYGAIAMWTMADKLACGLQQLMAGARKFQLNRSPAMICLPATGKQPRKPASPTSPMPRMTAPGRFWRLMHHSCISGQGQPARKCILLSDLQPQEFGHDLADILPLLRGFLGKIDEITGPRLLPLPIHPQGECSTDDVPHFFALVIEKMTGQPTARSIRRRKGLDTGILHVRRQQPGPRNQPLWDLIQADTHPSLPG
jgi:hypothetical protein